MTANICKSYQEQILYKKAFQLVLNCQKQTNIEKRQKERERLVFKKKAY